MWQFEDLKIESATADIRLYNKTTTTKGRNKGRPIFQFFDDRKDCVPPLYPKSKKRKEVCDRKGKQ